MFNSVTLPDHGSGMTSSRNPQHSYHIGEHAHVNGELAKACVKFRKAGGSSGTHRLYAEATAATEEYRSAGREALQLPNMQDAAGLMLMSLH